MFGDPPWIVEIQQTHLRAFKDMGEFMFACDEGWLLLLEFHSRAFHGLETFGFSLALQAGFLGRGFRLDLPGLGLGPGTDQPGPGRPVGLPVLVLALVIDELFLALGQFDAVLKPVLLDGQFLLHGHGPPLECGLIGLSRN